MTLTSCVATPMPIILANASTSCRQFHSVEGVSDICYRLLSMLSAMRGDKSRRSEFATARPNVECHWRLFVRSLWLLVSSERNARFSGAKDLAICAAFVASYVHGNYRVRAAVHAG